ncbi:hypothetical protein [Microbacterium sp. NPDC096154]|uniref:hypothetical protein n=1 Tax=Microbacterium sp. NPDC096154 TaxID=3155549 RepID=UPI0033288730
MTSHEDDVVDPDETVRAQILDALPGPGFGLTPLGDPAAEVCADGMCRLPV